MSKSSKVSKSQVDTIAIVTELIHYQSSKVSKSQVDTIPWGGERHKKTMVLEGSQISG